LLWILECPLPGPGAVIRIVVKTHHSIHSTIELKAQALRRELPNDGDPSTSEENEAAGAVKQCWLLDLRVRTREQDTITSGRPFVTLRLARTS